MSKNQLINLFSTPSKALGAIKKAVNNLIDEIKPMKTEDKLRLKKCKRGHNQTEKRSR